MQPVLRPALAGAAATFSGIGLSRFAYVPLFPAMVSAGWITGADGALLGALNLAGYLAGVLGGRALARRAGTPRALDLGMLLAVLAFAGCAWNLGILWLALWRFAAGAAGGALMALAGPAVQAVVPPDRRGFAGGLVVSGVGAGIVLGSALVAATLPFGLPAAWLGCSALVLVLWIGLRAGWPAAPVVGMVDGPRPRAADLIVSYGLSAAGLVPHMVYFADLAVRGRGHPAAAGPLLWLVFGVGTLAGTLLGGRASDRFGAALALRIWLAIQVFALGFGLMADLPSLAVSAFLGGFSALGLSTITLARARELAGPAAGLVWVQATASFAVAQAIAGFALAGLFRSTGSHRDVFLVGLFLSVLALAVGLFGRERSSRAVPGSTEPPDRR